MKARTNMSLRKIIGAAAVSIWFLAVAAGMAWFTDYKSKPGHQPLSLEGLNLGSNGGTLPKLVVILHPKCPCSKASLAEIERLLARNPNSLSATALFFSPMSKNQEWVRTDLWDQASLVPGLNIGTIGDDELKKLGHVTSGQVFLYGIEGNMVFSGGVTVGRGHEGDNTGIASIESYIRQGNATTPTSPVFGCILSTPGGDE